MLGSQDLNEHSGKELGGRRSRPSSNRTACRGSPFTSALVQNVRVYERRAARVSATLEQGAAPPPSR